MNKAGFTVTSVACALRKERGSRNASTLFSLTKNLVYKNIEAQMWKKIRTIVKKSPALNRRI